MERITLDLWFNSWLSNALKFMSKVIFSGLESSGKSLKLAHVVSELVYRNSAWAKESGIIRPIASNMLFSEEFTRFAVKDKGVPLLYWENLDDLIKYENCDIIIDEVGNYFDSRMWTDLSLDVRRWLTQGAKSGIEIYGSAQDFGQVDKAFRRLVNSLVHITKLCGSRRPSATKPSVKFIWGICLMQDLDPRAYNEDDKKFASGSLLPSFFFIERKYCEIFDTGQKIKRSKLYPYKHQERECEIPRCVYLQPHKRVYHT